ncbi:MAG: PRD domain-containing protein [Bacillota bacterium]|nr:PRD domain-containing protein [Bacillota bacterium]
MQNNYEIIKIMNNNIILVKNLQTDNEAVLVGKGIGFGKKTNSLVKISKNAIEKMFITYDEKLKKDYFEIIDSIDNVIIETCSEIILKAEEVLGKLNSRIHIVLTDHISFALERMNMGLTIENPFINEIRILYKKEYEIAVEARQLLNKRMNIDIGEGEVGFIALHINAAKLNKEVKETLKETRLIKELVAIIEKELNYKIENSITYNRLIDHLKGCIHRVRTKTTVNNPLIEILKKEFSESFDIALKIKERLDEELDEKIPIGELGYLTIHINRVKNVKNA